ncbi:hypothetical protein T492DRAFT_598147, partial [Pavlovales sp. CCMP2436]
VRCAVCPSTRGAFKRTVAGKWGGWMHVLCATWVPGLGFKSADTLTGAAGVDLLQPDRLRLSCTFCAQRAGAAASAGTPGTPAGSGRGKGKGKPRAQGLPSKDGRSSVCVQCSLGKCMSAFHVTCAQEAGCFMQISEGASAKDELLREILCSRHSAHVRAARPPPLPPLSLPHIATPLPLWPPR